MLTIYTLEQSGEWDEIVRSFRDYDVYWLSGYVRAFQIHGDGEPLLFFYEGKQVRGINVVMKRNIVDIPHVSGIVPQDAYYDFSTPYGYGGWIIEGDSPGDLFQEYEKWCQKNNIISEFVRFHPVIQNYLKSQKFYDVTSQGKVITMDLASPETIWANMTSKNRNMVRKAQKSGIQIYNGRFPQIFEIFQEIYNATMNKDHARDYYYFGKEFYQSILNDLSRNSQVFFAELDERVIAISIMLVANGHMNYHLSGSIKEYSHLAPTNLLLYEAALWGYENKCKTLYLGGGVGSSEDSLFKFKKSFFRSDETSYFYTGKKIFDLEKYVELCKARSMTVQNLYEGFFPKYRLEAVE